MVATRCKLSLDHSSSTPGATTRSKLGPRGRITMNVLASSDAPPGPVGYPFVGVFPMARRDPFGFFTSCVRRHGDVVTMRLGRQQVYLLRHPDHVKHVLQDRAPVYAKGPTASPVRGLFGESLTMIDGERWRRRRRHVQPVFHAPRHADFASVASRACADMLENWRLVAERGEIVDLVVEMRGLAQTIIIRACFGEGAEGERRGLCRALDVAVAHVDRQLWSPIAWLDIPTPLSAPGRRAIGEIEAYILRATSRARRSRLLPGTLLSGLLEFAGEDLSTAEIHDEIKAFLMAGHTTTASGLAWIWCVLSEHVEARELIEDECTAVLGSRPPELADLPALAYTRRVIEEVL